MTYALQIEDIDIDHLDLDLWYSRNPDSEIREKCERFNRSCRRLKYEKDSLEEDEWLIAFYGFIPLHYDYEGIPDMYDYHFMKYEDGVWMHRPSIGKDICPVPSEVISAFKAEGYSPQYFAVKRIED